MKKAIIAIIAVLLLGGGGFGAYTFFNKPAEATESKEVEKAAEAAKEAVPPTFVELKPLVLPVVDRDGVSQIISIVISIETDDPAKAAEIELMRPRLTDAYIQGMYGVLSSKAVMEGGILQVGYIKTKLHNITNKVMGKDKVKDVLLQVVQQRQV
ncbi:MAG: flagellar basal body-associated FliL family protein [Micavibrio aeruginosavorus]|uniref:Flagellar basal body-associated FliL family protein n=1 Tax=Micavibrio aeruginosavorus TaxID=349221 RepID=A0A2W5HP10_9BACT|nr:MAG: flagellar basal body-associated FliL family protein [Micavibrio aeruginosavorus]